MDWEAIKAEIHRRGSTIKELAKDSGLSPSTFSQAKRKRNKKAEIAIAAFIERKPQELWPDRYAKKTRIISNAYKELLASRKSNAAAANDSMVNEKQKAAV